MFMQNIKNCNFYEMDCIYDSRKSFYGKAYIKEWVDDKGYVVKKVLYSYGLEICKIEGGEFIKINNYYSQTTMRHITEFRLQNNLKAISKKEWLNIERQE